jgi:hypothetical protein
MLISSWQHEILSLTLGFCGLEGKSIYKSPSQAARGELGNFEGVSLIQMDRKQEM